MPDEKMVRRIHISAVHKRPLENCPLCEELRNRLSSQPVYDAMIQRQQGEEDPLVQEPKK